MVWIDPAVVPDAKKREAVKNLICTAAVKRWKALRDQTKLSATRHTTRSHASRLDRHIIVRPTSTRWPGGMKVRIVKFGPDVRQGVRASLPVGSFAVMHPDAGQKLDDGTVRVHEDDLRDTAD